jgi:sulfoxide reductase heme-binding subunit YedZ
MTTSLFHLASAGPSTAWYLTRSTGAVALLLLSLAVALGVADVRRFATPSWPRFIVDTLHRNVSLLALLFLVLHILTAVLDTFAPISLFAAVVPFISPYRPFWLGLGAVAFDLLLAVILTSLLRRRVGTPVWRLVHWLAYACWPVALLHTVGTGSDAKAAWLLSLSLVSFAIVLAAVLARTLLGRPALAARARGLALGGAAAFTAGFALWLPSGPLGSEWARRSGTPASLLGHASASSSSSRIVVNP